MFILHQSNRLEVLLDQLLTMLATPLAEVMAPETVIVQSQGMARWLSLMLAEKQGICANLDCPFPASFIWRLFTALDRAKLAAPSPYEPEALLWSIMEIIGRLLEHPAFGEVKAYVNRQGPELRRYQLASKVAALFSQYLIQRPEWIRAWGAGSGPPLENEAMNWQAVIWRELLARHGQTHRVALFDAMRAYPAAELLVRISLPERLSLFGIPALPQAQLAVFSHLSQAVDVHLFLLTPSQHYWGDLAGKKELARAALTDKSLDPVADLHLEEGCPLLTGLGRLGRDFQSLLLSLDEVAEEAAFVDPGTDTLLTLIQSDILAGLRGEALPENLARRYPPDSSLQIHAAHSPLREVEILYDQLLDLLQDNLELEARDILVMVPDISTYAPMIDAVFLQQAEPGRSIPFSIADRHSPGAIATIFFELLTLAGSRAEVNQVLAVLAQEPVRSQFGFSAAEMTALQTHLARAPIHWGLDGAHRQRFGVPPQEVGSWQHGLDRLLLGYLMPGDEARLFAGILPYDLLEGSDGELLGKLLHFHQALGALAEQCRHRYPLGQWQDLLHGVLATFVGSREEDHRQLQKIRSAITALAIDAETAGFGEQISLEVVSAALREKLTPAFDQDFLSGRVTFCQLVPMRSIPFKVICLLGMNDNAFPRAARAVGFDLMEKDRRPGDRDRRDDDRYLFLETLLSARQTLYLSYVGLNDRDHRQAPPSVVVSELLEYLGQRLAWSREQVAALVRRHPLQPFSRRYFSGELFSYSPPNREIAGRLGANQVFGGLFAEPGARLAAPAQAGPELPEVAIADFIRFFEHPVRFLLRNRFDLLLDDYFDRPEARECFSLDSLDKYQLALALTERELAGSAPEQQQLIIQKRGELPVGRGGGYYYHQVRREVLGFAEAIKKARGAEELEALPISLPCGPLRLSGSLSGLWAAGLCLYRPGLAKNIGYRGLIGAWIRHLLLNAAATEAPRQTHYVFRDTCLGFAPYAEASQELARLAEIFVAGQSQPLPLFPRSSYAYAQTIWGSKAETDLSARALAQAEDLWRRGDFLGAAPEKEDPYLAAAFGEADPFLNQGPLGFAETAELVLSKAIMLLKKF